MGRYLMSSGSVKKTRTSVFRELGLDTDLCTHGPPRASADPRTRAAEDDDRISVPSPAARAEDDLCARADSTTKSDGRDDCHTAQDTSYPDWDAPPPRRSSWYSKFTSAYSRPRRSTTAPESGATSPTSSTRRRLAMIALLVGVVLPSVKRHNARDMAEVTNAAEAGVVRRQDNISPVDACLRWSHQAAFLNGSVYIYGGQARTTAEQTTYTWNTNFLTLDLSEDWNTDSPSLAGLPLPNGPPAVANGYLWHDYNNLYLYGGLFSDNMGGENKYAPPAPVSLWRYSVADHAWTEFPEPHTSAGKYAEPANVPVQRSAEGAGQSVPELGLSWYFGGHLDWSTTPGWSTQTRRVYVKSLLEFTHPGYTNNAVDELAQGGAGAADGGVFRNITQGGIQDSSGFPERADGVLVFVPGWGESGVLIGMAGGTDSTFTQDLRRLDVYDIANSEWYHQETTGDLPSVRVNACAAIASAPDASSFQIYFYGGQNLQPYSKQIQYNDMYILTIPSFTWIRVSTADNAPRGRAGHTCTMRDGQIVIVGGYLGQEGKGAECESPAIHVFDASTLEWLSGFKAGDHAPDFSPDNSVLAGSYGYKVPDPVQQVIGGDSEGGATVTTPAAGSASRGPFATGKPPVFTITQGGAAGPTVTAAPSADEQPNGPNPGLIAAAIIAGLLGLLAVYLCFCIWVYRRQVAVYRKHVAITNRSSATSSNSAGSGVVGFLRRVSGFRRPSMENEEWFGWVGSGGVEPKWSSSDEPTPISNPNLNPGRRDASGSGGVPQWQRRSEDGRMMGGAMPRDGDGHSMSSTEQLIDGHEPNFFSVVLAPRRALRVVNGADSDGET